MWVEKLELLFIKLAMSTHFISWTVIEHIIYSLSIDIVQQNAYPVRFSHMWLIQKDAEKLADGRLKNINFSMKLLLRKNENRFIGLSKFGKQILLMFVKNFLKSFRQIIGITK